jgi:alpha-D-ribose 1-methylphosphonate 5-triphosphate synthase subunit PhnH
VNDVIAAGFADPVFDAQSTFRGLMNATARPGTTQAVAPVPAAPSILGGTLAAVTLALVDHETTLHLDGPIDADATARAFLAFHTGAPRVTSLAEAAFALVSDGRALPDLADCARGTDAYPDRSTTLIARVARFGEGRRYRLSGPGIDGVTIVAIDGLPEDIVSRLAANRALFPRGVDILLCGPSSVLALPRTTRVEEA